MAELRNLADDTLSFYDAVEETMHAKYTQAKADKAIFPYIVKRKLTPALSKALLPTIESKYLLRNACSLTHNPDRVNPILAQEVDECFHQELSACDITDDFVEFNAHQLVLRMVTKVSGRVFIGPELNQTKEYINATSGYTMDLIKAAQAINKIKPWMRWLKAPRIPEVQALKRRLDTAVNIIGPVVAARENALKKDPNNWQKPDDLLQWIIDDQNRLGEYGGSVEDIAVTQLGITFAAINTTAFTILNALYNLATMPELVLELREEIKRGLAEEHAGTLAWSTHALQQMKKLDSFIRETMRFHPFVLSAFGRKVMKTFALSSGQVIPAGSAIEVAAHAVNFDPEVYTNPDDFDALRFYKARESKEGSSAATNQFVSVTPANLAFGYGRHSCPGRFYAANVIKMIVCRAVLDYDIKLAEGSSERYSNLSIGGSVSNARPLSQSNMSNGETRGF